MTETSKIPAAQNIIQDPPEYAVAPEDPSQAAPSSSLDQLPPWSIPAAENATDSVEGNIQKTWNSGHPGGVALEDPTEAAPSNPDAVTQVSSSTSHQTQEDRGQLKWEEQRRGETEAAPSSSSGSPEAVTQEALRGQLKWE